jgi:uncharacterized protein (TIGR02449 family)
MDELLQRLEKKLKNLLDQHDELKLSNQQLYQNKSKLVAREKALINKHQKAISQIKNLISRLREFEKIS